jgi:hypothetical protein
MLLHQTEALAEAALGCGTPTSLPWPPENTAVLLSGVDTTINRLRSVATALALASDATRDRART